MLNQLIVGAKQAPVRLYKELCCKLCTLKKERKTAALKSSITNELDLPKLADT